jgi:flagellar basal-body rod modification protein FlgD
MPLDALSASGASTTSAGLNKSKASIAENFDTFLSILTTQLKNQNPLEPLDTNQFTQQLVQFTSVEQQLKTNEYLEALILANQSVGQTQATSFIGKTITSSGANSELSGGHAEWSYSLQNDAPKAYISIRDQSGRTLFSEQTSLGAGENTYVWDGVTSDGTSASDGTYSITIDARNEEGQYVPVSTQTTGVVDGVDFGSYEPILIVGGARVKMSSVNSVSAN